MSEAQQEQPKTPKGRGALIAAAAAAILLGVGAGVLYAHRQQSHTAASDGAAKATAGALGAYAKGSLAKLTASAPGAPLPTASFNDAEGRPMTLASFKGKVAVVNLWATWCAPCVVEMPTLAALQRRYAGSDLVVAAISVDRDSDLADAKNFIGVNEPLELYHDGKFALPAALKVQGLPATVIYDRDGREVARIQGEAKWDSPEVIALMDHLLKP